MNGQLGALKDVDLVRLDATDIREGLEGYDAVVFTGGVAGSQARTIGVTGREQVRRFVERGGGYVGHLCRRLPRVRWVLLELQDSRCDNALLEMDARHRRSEDAGQ